MHRFAPLRSYACQPQKDKNLNPRSEAEEICFTRGLEAMPSCYASITGTTVIQLKDVLPRPKQYDGLVQLFELPDNLLKETALRSFLATFGKLQSCEMKRSERKAEVRFATHAEAERAITEFTKQGRAASGLRWVALGYFRPSKGNELVSAQLSEALSKKTEFTSKELKQFGVKDVRTDHFVKSGSTYFIPVGAVAMVYNSRQYDDEAKVRAFAFFAQL